MDWPQALTVFVAFAFISAVQSVSYLRRWSLHFALWISLAFIYLVQPTLSSLIAILGKAFMSTGLHRTHQATGIDLQNASFSFWDRLFALHHTGPVAPPVGLTGLPASSTFSPLFLLVTLPWRESRNSVPAMSHSKSKAAPPLAIHT